LPLRGLLKRNGDHGRERNFASEPCPLAPSKGPLGN